MANLARLRGRAARNLGLFSTRDLTELRVSKDVLDCRLRSGEWERVHRGVFRVAGHPTSFEQDLLAAIIFNGPGAVASHRSAARLWGLPGFGRGRTTEVSKPRGRSQRREYGLVHGSKVLPPPHVTLHAEIPVTVPARTVFDLAGIVHPKRTERALDTMLAKKLVTVGQLEVVFAQLARRGRRGTALMRELLEARGEGYVAPTSELEAVGRAVLAGADLPAPVVERNLGDGDDWIGRVDLTFPAVRLVVELDSRRHHTSLLDRDSDRRRDNRLMAAGWRVLRFTWWDLTERPTDVVAQVRAALAA